MFRRCAACNSCSPRSPRDGHRRPALGEGVGGGQSRCCWEHPAQAQGPSLEKGEAPSAWPIKHSQPHTLPAPSLCAPEQASFLPGEDGAKALRLLPVSFPVASGHHLALQNGCPVVLKEKKNSFLQQQAVPGQPWSGGGGALPQVGRRRALQVTALQSPGAALSFCLQLICG